MKRVDLRDDSGATLIMVLVLVTVMAVGLSALLTLTDTNVRATVALREQAAAVYDADGAMQTAINGIRESAYTGASGQHCFGGSDTMSVPAPSGTGSAAVTCTADPAKVLVHCPSLATCNRPGSAVLTLGRTAGEDGLHIEQPNAGSTFRVHGTIFSNSTIAVDNGTLSTNARVYARGTCTGTIVSTPAPSCDYGSTANPLGDDPGYAPATSVVPPWRALPACTTPDSVVAFEPGYYDDAAGLSAMMAGNSACRRSTWWFKPGVYYFDFHNSGSNANPVLPNAPNVWTVDDGHLVAGTPVNAAGAVVATPSVPAAIPGACQNPIKNAGAVGVQFIFGGDSQFAVKSGQVEICGTYSVTRPPVAVYGLKSGSDTVTTANGAQPTSVTPGAFADATTARLASLEGTYAAGSFASWTTNANTNNQSGQVTTDGYGQTTIPAGSVLVSAKLRVGHRYRPQAGGRPSEALSAIVTPAGAPAFTVPVPAYAGTSPRAKWTQWTSPRSSREPCAPAGSPARRSRSAPSSGSAARKTWTACSSTWSTSPPRCAPGPGASPRARTPGSATPPLRARQHGQQQRQRVLRAGHHLRPERRARRDPEQRRRAGVPVRRRRPQRVGEADRQLQLQRAGDRGARRRPRLRVQRAPRGHAVPDHGHVRASGHARAHRQGRLHRRRPGLAHTRQAAGRGAELVVTRLAGGRCTARPARRPRGSR
ncbi:hypothetical protein ACFQV2_21425 [Actinokineospora soli]|uniref:Type 4 fimbrial biogenesis protein PilX N-terminal domain-containing protein n=1 Tax=Actinokineospora soli TaxID=1048753 RepID=A0ABW2TR61_9PSEU